MAEVLPNGRRDTITFFRVHLPVWRADPAAVGLTKAQTDALAAMVAAADAAAAAADAARAAALGATTAFHTEADAMRRFGAGLIKAIKAHAGASGGAGVYAQAQIPPPASPSPTPPPETPGDPTATLDAFGRVRLEWEAARSGGVQFLVERRLTPLSGPPGAWSLVGLSASGGLTDEALPAGYAGASYIVTAASRAGRSAASGAAVLAFGIPGAEGAGAGRDLVI